MITNPILAQAYDADWYYPYQPSEETRELPQYQTAIEEGWHEWIEADIDVEAIRQGYYFDLSRDFDGNPAYWFMGAWQLHDGTRVEVKDEKHYIQHCGKADRVMRFAEVFLRHNKGELAGKPYTLIHWMRKLVATLFGWVHRDSGLRRYQHVYIALAKKNAKSALLSVLALYMLVADGTPKAYVYGAACDRQMGRIIYDEAMHMVKGSPALEKTITVVDSRSRLVHQASGSFYTVLSADAHRNDGIDSSCTLVDEIHRHPNRKLYTVLKRAGQARANPLLAVITTYGPSLGDGSIWAEVHNEAKAQLEGRRPKSIHNLVMVASAEPIPVVASAPAAAGDTRIYVTRLQQPVDRSTIEFDLSQFAEDEVERVENKVKVTISKPAKRFQNYIEVEPLERDLPAFSEAVANEDWRSDHAIVRANPSVGITFPLARLRKEIDEARTPEAEAETRQLNLNIVSGSGRKWISTAAWQACGKMLVQPKKLIGRECYGGFDLSFNNDLTGFVLAFPSWDLDTRFVDVIDPRIDLLCWSWVPDKTVEDREEFEKFPYRYHAKQPYLFDDRGTVRLCEGPVINYAQVAEEIVEICSKFRCRGIAYDPNMAQFAVSKLEYEGLTCVAHKQGGMGMSPPCKQFSLLAYKGQLAHGNNPVLDRCVEGAVLKRPDPAGNTYLSKGDSHVRIDTLVAAVMAVGFATNPPDSDGGAWATSEAGMWG